MRTTLESFTQFDDEKIHLVHYLDATLLREGGPSGGGSVEKEHYLRIVAHLVETLPFLPDEDIAVFGVGGGGESRMIAEILNRRFKEGGPGILSIDYDPVILNRLEKSCKENPDEYQRVMDGVMLLDAMNMDKKIKPGSLRLSTNSSIWHEYRSFGGSKALFRGFNQNVIATANGGLIVGRDFAPPSWQLGQVELLTPLAQKFFERFTESYTSSVKPKWTKEWTKTNNILTTNSLHAFDLLTHFRMFVNDHSERLRSQMLEDQVFFKKWHESDETYVITGEERPSVQKVLEGLVAEAVPYGFLAHTLGFTDDSANDTILQQNFEIKGMKDFFPSKRFLAIFKKGEKAQ